MMLIFFFGTALACFATAATNSFVALAGGLSAIGLVASIYHPVGAPMMVASAPPERLGRVIGMNGVFGNLAIAGAPFVTGAITDLFGWRVAFVAGFPPDGRLTLIRCARCVTNSRTYVMRLFMPSRGWRGRSPQGRADVSSLGGRSEIGGPCGGRSYR